MSPIMLLSSSFAQEQYITLTASQLYSMPGTYMLQVFETGHHCLSCELWARVRAHTHTHYHHNHNNNICLQGSAEGYSSLGVHIHLLWRSSTCCSHALTPPTLIQHRLVHSCCDTVPEPKAPQVLNLLLLLLLLLGFVLQIINEYGAPQYALTADVTSATTLTHAEDRAAISQIINDCCSTTNGLVCATYVVIDRLAWDARLKSRAACSSCVHRYTHTAERHACSQPLYVCSSC